MPDGLYAGIFDDLIRTCFNGKRDHAVEQAVYISAADQWYVDRKKRAYGLCVSEFYFDVPASRSSLECHDERYDKEDFFLDPSEPLILFFIDYVAIMGLFVFIGHYLARLLRQVGNNRKTDQRKER